MSLSTATPARSRKAKKAKMLVVDDEPDNLDLLYRTFRREFNVLRAESGQQALDVLAEHGEVAVIISDQRMPEMKGTEFLSKTVPEFPDTVRIILTGFTDVEDLVDAINAGQVYRYITKPWDPEELRRVVERAAETYEILKQRGEAIKRSQVQHDLVITLAEIAEAASDLNSALPKIAEATQHVLKAAGCVVHLASPDDGLGDAAGSAGTGNIDFLKADPLTAAAISAKAIQVVSNAATEAGFEAKSAYQSANIVTHCVTPITFRDRVTAVLSLQWQAPQELSEADLQLIQLAAKQIGLTLACL
ncbi:MAG: response regulator [Leptolyngbyaceae cyanobacterium T60_A2020_046]|nr:response regulator [Leptolyngbyaceae cyanobacterium T60_A2020_046]